MQIEIDHDIAYRYEPAVFCEPLTVRLRPRQDPHQRLLSFELTVTPPPAGRSEFLDLNGNEVTRVWFEERTDHLELAARSVVETQRSNPFEFLVDEDALRLPWRYGAGGIPWTETSRHAGAVDPRVSDFTRQIVRDTHDDTLAFLVELCRRIRAQCEPIDRPDGAAHPASKTLADGHGARRDLAVLFNECCRLMGIPARFASGYAVGDPETRNELHAWSEVYLPGAGWRGFDASLGLAVADEHVVVATAAEPPAAAPTEGTYRGTVTTNEMHTTVAVRAGEHDET